ncbi:MAG: hypothetical protein A4E32_00821 [Methanomassiliicoccales archaeon PtaU1.Bin124]|nr:MAG: hypothetical protein A4E32_00821 [Methanomassiliicoccales archaeon PtaU1.Bin124]
MVNNVTPISQLKRQIGWLGGSWKWLLQNKMVPQAGCRGRPSALDVGCGPGLVMELFSPDLDVKGIDIDPEAVSAARERGLDVIQADAADLPFDDGSFDIVYCSFTLLWVEDALQAVKEMARVSRGVVACLAEPDYGGRVCHPPEVASLDRYIIGSLIEEGADPFIGRRLGGLMEATGLKVESGVHSGIWAPAQLRAEAAQEWGSIRQAVGDRASPDELELARKAWDAALAECTLFLFNPVFYAIGRKA